MRINIEKVPFFSLVTFITALQCNIEHFLVNNVESVNHVLVLNKTNDLILNLTPENVTQHSRIVTTTRKGSSTPTKMSKIIGRQIP